MLQKLGMQYFSWNYCQMVVIKVPKVCQKAKGRGLIFENFPERWTTWDIPENCKKYDFLLKVVISVILVIFSDFGRGQPKNHFLTHFANFGHEGGSKVTQINYNMEIEWVKSYLGGKTEEFGSPGAEIWLFQKNKYGQCHWS